MIETDGDRYHRTPYRQRLDAQKQEIVEKAGYGVLRLDDNDALPEHEDRTVALIWRKLGEPPQTGPA